MVIDGDLAVRARADDVSFPLARFASIPRELASEFRALAQLPGIDDARTWEPEPERVYAWAR